MYLLLPSEFPPHAPTIIPRSADESQCGFEGNDDIYGIGIRIGIYSQILAVWVANYFLFSEAQVLRDSVSIFSVALLIVAIIYTTKPQDVYAAEAFVLLQILAWSCIMGVRAKSGYNKGIFSRGSLLRRGVCEVVNFVNVGLHTWFWWVGIDKMKKTHCGTYIMMYVVKTSMFGWARKVMMAMSLFVLCCTIYWASVEFSRPWTMRKISKARKEFIEAVKRWEAVVTQSASNTNTAEEGDKDSGQICVCADGDDACSRSSCSYCSPTRSHFGFDRETALTIEPKRNPTRTPTTEHSITPTMLVDETGSKVFLPLPSKTQVDILSIESPTLQDVYESELYIQHCISGSPYQMSPDGKPLALPIIIRSIISPAKFRTSASINNPPSWFRCHLYTWALFFTFRFPPQALIVYSHLRQSRLLDPLNGPFQLYAAVTYKPVGGKGLPKWPSVSIASSMMLVAPEMPKKVWLGWYYTILDLAIHVIVILQLELTLRWNNVSGLSGLWTSVGQLIPFIIGTAGLLLVSSRWGVRAWVKWKKGKGMKSGWDKDELLSDAKEGEEQCNETFGIEENVRGGYARWKDWQMDQLSWAMRAES